jgi:hypothetical protein
MTGDGAGVSVLQFTFSANNSHLAAIYWDRVQFLTFRDFSIVGLAGNGSALGTRTIAEHTIAAHTSTLKLHTIVTGVLLT